MNVALFWSFNETTYDTYSGLRAATELEAREVDQLWEHGKALRGKVQQMQQELDSFKAIMEKEQTLRERTRDKHTHSFSLGGQFLLNALKLQDHRRTELLEEPNTAELGTEKVSEIVPETPVDDSIADGIERHKFKLSYEEAQKALKIQEELTKPVIKKFRLSAKDVVAAAKLSGKDNAIKMNSHVQESRT